MKWYNVLTRGNTASKKPFVADSDNLRFAEKRDGGFYALDFLMGRRFKTWRCDVRFWTSKKSLDGCPDDALWNSAGVHLWSARFQRLIAEEGITGIQFLPVEVRRFDGSQLEGYAIANVLNLIDALDRECSDIAYYGNDAPKRERNRIYVIYRPVLSSSSVAPYDILRQKGYPLALYASGRFKNVYDQNRLTGLGFDAVEVKLSSEKSH